MAIHPGPGQDETRSQELERGLLNEWSRTQVLGLSSAAFSGVLTGCMKCDQVTRTPTSTPIWEIVIANRH